MLPPDSMEKEYEQIVRTPIVFSAGKTCFMEGTPLRLSSFLEQMTGIRTQTCGEMLCLTIVGIAARYGKAHALRGSDSYNALKKKRASLRLSSFFGADDGNLNPNVR